MWSPVARSTELTTRLTQLRHRSRQKRLSSASTTFSSVPRALNSRLFEQRQRSLRYTTALSAPFHGAPAADEWPPLQRVHPVPEGAGDRRKRRKPGRDVYARSTGAGAGSRARPGRDLTQRRSTGRQVPRHRALQIRGAEESRRAAQEAKDAGDQRDQDASQYRRPRLRHQDEEG